MAKKTPEINSSSTADMAFILLCFFLMTTTMDQDKGLQRRLPPMPDPNQKAQDQKVNRRNIIVVKINSADRLLAGTEPMDVSQLKDKINFNFSPGLIKSKNFLLCAFGIAQSFAFPHAHTFFNSGSAS